MFARPAARVGDPTYHTNPLGPGIGSLDVHIGKKPAWRGITPTQVLKLTETIAEITEDIAKAMPNPTALAVVIIESLDEVLSLIKSFVVDIHACAVVKVTIPDGAGVVIDGSRTVLINGLAACRQGDTIQETTAINKIARGERTVKIGG